MKQKVKSNDTNNKNDIFKDCQAKWDKEEDTKEKLTTSLSVPEHYKKYTIEECKIMWQKPNRQQPAIGVSFEGLEDVDKIDLVGPSKDAKSIYIATDLEPNKERSLIGILCKIRDWLYTDLKGFYPFFCLHTIPF